MKSARSVLASLPGTAFCRGPGRCAGPDLDISHDLFFRCPLFQVFLILALLFAASAVAQDKEYSLIDVQQVGGASVKDKDLTYKTDLIFREAPENFWIFFDKQKSQLVLDMYSGKIEAAASINVRGSAVFKRVQVANRQTSMSLSGVEALVLLDAEPGWHFEASAIAKTVVRITAWKTLQTPKTVVKAHKGSRVFFAILAAAAASAATFFLIYYVGRTGD